MENNNNTNQSNLSVIDIPLLDISPNPFQPRVKFLEEGLSSLASSISQYGVMQPIVVIKKDDGKYEIISGERRWRASKIAEQETIPAVVRNHKHTDAEKFELAIIENLQREDLNPVDKARSFKRLVDEFKMTHNDIAVKVGKSREYISNSLRLLSLPDEILNAMVSGVISEAHARPLLMLKDRIFEQNELFKKIISSGLTVRSAGKMASSILANKTIKNISKQNSDIRNMETKLAEKLGTKVSISEKDGTDGGKLTIEYFSIEDLEKIVDLVKGKKLSSSPILDIDDGVDKFNENYKEEEKDLKVFSEEVGKIEENTSIEVKNTIKEIEGTEIIKTENLDNDFDKTESIEKNNDENLDGYDISFSGVGDYKKDETITLEEQDLNQKEETVIKEKIDNFGAANWKEKKNQEVFDNELNNLISEKIDKEETKSDVQKRVDKILKEDNMVKKNSELGSEIKEENQGEFNDKSIYEQFLVSKKKIEDQKKRIYEDPKEKENEFSETTADFMRKNGVVNFSDSDKYKINKSKEKMFKRMSGVINSSENIENSIESSKNSIENSAKENVNSSENNDKAEPIFNGSDFVPQKKVEAGGDAILTDNTDNYREDTSINNEDGINKFSI